MTGRWRPTLRAALIVILAGVVIWGIVDGAARGPSPDRVGRLTRQLRCPVCRGEAVADSPSSSARTIENEIRQQVAAGWTDQQIRDYYVSRFGRSILLDPPRTGSTLVLWVLPLVVLTGGAIAVLGMLPDGRRRVAWRWTTAGLGAAATAALVVAGATQAGARPPAALPLDSVVQPAGTAPTRDLSTVTNAEMEAVIAKNPSVIGMRLALATRYLDAGDVADALRHTAVAIDLPATDQEYERALRLHGWASALNGAPTLGADYLRAAIALSPTDRDALFFLAKVEFEALHDPHAAKLALDRLAKLTMDDTQVQVVGQLRAAVDAALATAGTSAGSAP